MKLYVSGPMTGVPAHNFPAFNQAASELVAAGYEVLNPADNFGGATDRDRSEYMRLDIQHVLAADGLAMLKGWESSKGAMLEVAIAQELKLPVNTVGTWITGEDERVTPSESILEEAQRLVHGNRGHNYGPPSRDFSRTALIWDALFGHRMRYGERFKPEDIGLAMIAVKMSREVNRPKRDNRVDIAGYAETVDMVWQERAEAVERRATSSTPADPNAVASV